jgi:DNA-binding XRE family transcriptional regulator
MTDLERAIDYDATPIKSAAMRRSVEKALDDLALRRRGGFWDSFSRVDHLVPVQQTVVIGDLHELAGTRGLDHLAAGPSNVSFVFLVRTEADRKRMHEPDTALRLNDEKFFVLDLAVEEAESRPTDLRLAEYFGPFVEQMEPDRLRCARFTPIDGVLWVEFGDGLQRAVAWRSLPFAERVGFTPFTASAQGHGQAVLLVDKDGRELDVDAGALRAAVDQVHRSIIDASDQAEAEVIGSRLRSVRKSMGLTQEQVASRSGIPQESLSRIETGQRQPRIETLRRLSAGLGMGVPELLARIATP